MVSNDFIAGEDRSLGITFNYPDDYKSFIKNKDKLNQTSWWLIGKTSGAFHACYDVINFDYKSTKLLIPFAKSDQSNILFWSN